MKRIGKTKPELARELKGLHTRVAALQRAEVEHKRAEEALRKSQQLLRKTFASLLDAVFILDAKTVIKDCNPAASEVFGYSRQEMLERTTAFLHVDQATLEDFRKHLYPAVEEKGLLFLPEFRLKRKDGTVFPTEHSVMPLEDDQGKRIGWVSMVRDITERKRAEEQIAYQAHLLAIVNDAIVASDAQYRLTAWNAAAESMYGWKAEEVLGRFGLDITRTEFPGVDKAEMLRAIAERGSWRGEATQARKDGTRFPVEASSFVLHDETGKVSGYVGVNRDITERKRAEEALRESEERFRRLYERAPLGYQSLDAEGRLIDVNQAWLDLLGYSHEQVIGRWFGDFLAPQEVDSFKERFPRFKAAGEVHVDVEMVQRAGSTIIVHIDGRIGHDAQGQFKQTHCILADITARKRAEEALRRSEEHLRSLIENALDIVAVVNADGAVRYVSPSIGQILGYEPDEMIGKDVSEFIHPDDLADWLSAFAHRRQHPGASDIPSEARVRHKDASWRILEGRGNNLLHEAAVAGIVINARDITERKRAEEEIAHLAKFPAENPNPVLRLSRDGIVIYANAASDALLRVWDCAVGSYAPQSWRDLIAQSLASRQNKSIDVECAEEVYSFFVAPVAQAGYVNLYGCDITERKRAEDELAHSHQLIATLNQVAAHLQTSLVADMIMETMGAELKRLGLTCAVTLVMPDGKSAVVRYMSFESRLLALAEKLMGATMRGYQLSHDHFLYFKEVIEQKRGVFVPDLLVVAIDLLHFIPKPLVEQATRLNGITHETPGVFLPLVVEDQAMGTLGIWGKHLKEADLPALSVFASQVAVAMQNAQLFEQVRIAREQLQALSHRLVEVQETERRYIARELHDEVGQVLTGLKMLLETSSRLPADTLRSRLSNAQSLVEQLMEQVQGLSLDLRPTMLDDLGLLPALLWLAKRFADQTGVHVHLEHAGLDRRFAPEIETAAYRITQEALTNVARHAGVKEATARLWVTLDTLHVQIEDRGQGFYVQAALAAPTSSGLSGMRERAVALGGNLIVESAPGAGTHVTLQVPLSGSLERRMKERRE